MSHLPHTPARTSLHSRVISAAFFVFVRKEVLFVVTEWSSFFFVFSFLFKSNRQVLQTNFKTIWMKQVL